MKKKNYFAWTWTLFVLFMALSIVDIRFGLLGYICMLSPLIHALLGKKKKHCNTYCPRASFLKNFMGKISLKHTLPKPMRSDRFRWILLSVMMVLFLFSLIRSRGDMVMIAGTMFRMIAGSSIVSLLLGFFYKERSWCTVCPMGFAAKLMGPGIAMPGTEKKAG